MEITDMITWGFGICATGFFFLALWIRQIADRILLAEIKEIKRALIGDIDKPGIVALLHIHSEDIKEIKLRCKELHSK
jgi:hypothetical protein